jgi:hypothetical protein
MLVQYGSSRLSVVVARIISVIGDAPPACALVRVQILLWRNATLLCREDRDDA